MAKYTSNYNLKKPSSEDFYNVEDQNGNMDIIDQELKRLNEDNQYTDQKISSVSSDLSSHLSDYVRQPGYAVTTGVANTYLAILNPAPAIFGEGLGIVLKIHAANTGPSTLNVNGIGAKPIIDSKGYQIQAGKLLHGRIYSLKYDGANFQLQGEGGEIPKLPNLIKNGNFEFDLNCWIVNNATASVLNNFLTFTPSFMYGGILQTVKQPLPGDQVYIRCNMKGSLSSRFIFYYKDGYGNPVLSPSVANTWQTLSEIATYSSDGDKAIIAFDDASSSSWSSTQIKNVMFFNLTQMFGRGNEPTKAEIDSIMDGGINKFSSRGLYIRHGLNAFSRENENSFWIRCDTGATYAFVDYPLTLKANTTYRLKATTIGANAVSAGTIIITSRDYSTQYGGGMPGNVNFTFTTPSDGMVSAIFYANSDSSSTTNPEASFINVSITEGSGDLPFVPYKPTDWWDSDLPLLTADALLDPAMLVQGYSGYADGIYKLGTLIRRNGDTNGYTNMNSKIENVWPAIDGGRLHFPVLPGAYVDNAILAEKERDTPMGYIDDPNFIPANIVNGTDIFGLVGSFTGRRWAVLTVPVNYSGRNYITDTGGTINGLGDLIYTGLDFTPSTIIYMKETPTNINEAQINVCSTLMQKINGYWLLWMPAYSNKIRLTGNTYFNTGGFSMPCQFSSGNMKVFVCE